MPHNKLLQNQPIINCRIVINILKQIAVDEKSGEYFECAFDMINGDDVCVEDYVGCNVDNAFDLGYQSGRKIFARELLELISNEKT